MSRLRAAALLLTAVVGLTACSPTIGTTDAAPVAADTTPLSELTPPADPRALEGPSTALLPESDIEPVQTDPAQTLPATVMSRDRAGDVEVTVTDASRIVAMDMAGSLAATVWGLGFGENLVARDITTRFPGVEDLPIITGSAHSVNAESVIALKPTLVLTDGSIGPIDVVTQLRDVGITVVFVENEPSFAGAADLARDVAATLGAPEAGELLAQRIDAEVAEIRTEVDRLAPADPADRLRVVFLYLRGSSGIYYLFGEDSGADDLIAGLAATDVASELGWRGMQPLTDEAIVAADPDLVLVMTSGLTSVGGVDALLEEKPAIAVTHAGQHRRVVDMEDGQVLSFGPRSAEVLAALARAVYAPRGDS